MLRVSLSLATAAAAVGLALVAPATAQAAPNAGDSCGPEQVINSHGQCLRIGSFCSLSDGMIIGSLGRDGRCVLPGTGG